MHRGRDDIGVVNFLCHALMEKVGFRAPGLQGCLHGWSGYGLVEEAE